MRRSSSGQRRQSQSDPAVTRARTDGGGVALFEVIGQPVIEYAVDDGTPVVRRVNPAFTDTFDITEEVAGIPLSTTLASVTAVNDAYSSLIEGTRRGEDAAVTCTCGTATGQSDFRVLTRHTEDGGYVVFTETPDDERLDILKYLTHSLRNPLEVATVHTEVIADTDDPEHIDTVQNAHKRMEAIIADTMELARQGSVVEETEPVDVAALAREAWETVRTDEATLTVESPGTVDADESRLRVLLENLFRNAVRHGSPEEDDGGDRIRVTVGGMADGFYVADNGRGIPVHDREQVLDAGYTTADDGTGLGLAIVAEIAVNHGWEITVTESDAGGSRFDFVT